jgi:hypothetical protein
MPTHLAALTGAALALASLTRTVGVPLVVIGAIFVLIRSAGWRPVVAYLALAVTPLVAYAGWFNSEQGQFNLTNADGVFLYARVMAFADCNIIKPPASLASLCDPRPPSQRPPGEAYIWHASLLEGFGPVAERALPEQRFTTARNEAALKFATRAIEAQPLSYLSVSLRDFGRTFGWSWEPYPNGAEVATYKFSDHPYGILDRVVVAGGTALGDAHRYDPSPSTRVVEPFADLMIGYQRILAARGPFIGVFLLVGLMGLLLPRRRIERRRELLIMLTFATVLLLVPPFTVEFDYRYVVPAIPLAAASCAMALAAMFPRCSDPGFTAEKPIRPRRRKAANFADAGGADSNGQLSGSPLC